MHKADDLCRGLPTRRDVLRAGALAVGSCFSSGMAFSAELPCKKPPRVAAIFDVFRHRSHANVILENFLLPYFFNGQRITPCPKIVSFYADQMPKDEMSRAVSREFQIPTYRTIEEALCLGGRDLAADAVLSIAEGGTYAINDQGQREYPRKRFFDAIVTVMRNTRRFVPLFNDKHLSYRWDWAKEMYDTTRELGIPFMAGSSLPFAERRPAMDIPNGANIEEAVAIHGGNLEIYDIHALEILQSLVEARRGGETGVVRVECVRGDALWKAAEAGRWSRSLAVAALQAEFGDRAIPLESIPGERADEPHGLLITYKDGLKATVLKLGHNYVRWNFACRMKHNQEIKATRMIVGPWRNRYLFKAFSHAIQQFIITGISPVPAERSLLTTGILESVMKSRRQNVPLDTPHLEISYQPRDFLALRETGATWKVLPADLPEPMNQLDRSGGLSAIPH